MFGVSAGSLMLAQEWLRFKSEDDHDPEIFPCLGIAPVHVDAHSEDDGWAELRILLRCIANRRGADALGYGLTRKGALRVTLGGASPEIEAQGTPIPRLAARAGRIIRRAPLSPPSR